MKWIEFLACVIFAAICGVAIKGILGASAEESSTVSTSVTTTAANTILTQEDYRWYGNVDNLTPTTPFAPEDTATTTPSAGTIVRLRMNVGAASLALNAGATFTLQFSNATSGGWTNVGTSTRWIFFDNPSVADGQIIVSTVLAQSTVGESYGESNPSAATPNAIPAGDFGEWDWALANNSAATSSDWFFRMVDSSGMALDSYGNYPEFTAAPTSTPGGGGGSGGGRSGGGPGQPGSGGGTGYYFPTSTPPFGTPPPSSATPPLPVPPPLIPPKFQCEDFDGDNRVDMIDLSILLYKYHERGPGIARLDCNNDGVINFTDVSILMFYWTGGIVPERTNEKRKRREADAHD